MNRTYQAPLYLLPFDHRYCYVAGMFRFTTPLTTEQSVHVRYDPEDDAALNRRQTMRLKQLSDHCRAVGQPFTFELLVPAMNAVEAVCVIQDAGVEPDTWKEEGFDRREDGERVVSAAEREGRGAVGSTVLERDADANEVVHWLKAAAAVPGFAGFAVERTTFWDAVTDFMEARVTRAETVSGIRGWVAVSERGTRAVTKPLPLVPRHTRKASLPPARSHRFHSNVRDRARQLHSPRAHTN